MKKITIVLLMIAVAALASGFFMELEPTPNRIGYALSGCGIVYLIAGILLLISHFTTWEVRT